MSDHRPCSGCGGDEFTCICDSSCPPDSRTGHITRAALNLVVEKAIEKGREKAYYYLTEEQTQFQIDAIRSIARTCRGVDYSCFDRQYGCPITQAGFRGNHAYWFTRWFDTYMHDLLEPYRDAGLESGWSAKVED